MIKNDFRYIVKRIIIGIGVCLGLSFLSGCSSVYAYEMNNDDLIVSGSYNSSQCRIYYSTDENKIFYYARPRSSSSWSQLLSLDYNSSYTYSFLGANNINSSPQRTCTIVYFTTDIYLANYTSGGVTRNSVFSNYSGSYYELATYDGSNISNSSPHNYTPGLVISNGGKNLFEVTDNNKKNYVNKEIFDNKTNSYILQDKVLPVFVQPTVSTIDNLGIRKNIDEENNVIVSYSFSPTFNNFDIDSFIYQYKIGDNEWLNINSNDVTFNVNQNTTVYFRVLDKSDNSIVDSRSITITNILNYNDSIDDDYNVKYTSENRNVNDDESISQHYVDTVVISFEYFPKYSNLKYQFQYVNEGDSLSSWNDMPNNDYERSYSVTSNGIMYNRILDENDNVLYTSTFKVNSIGTLMLNDNLNWYNKLFGKVNYGKGIYSIFFLPVRILEIYKNVLESGICTNGYSFGSLLGHELSIPCLNIRGLLGNTIYNFIDIIGVGVICIAIINFIVNIYNGIVFMNLQDRINEEDSKGGNRLL